MDSISSQCLPSLSQITSWDDRVLLSQDPFLDTFTSWKLYLDTASPTRTSKVRKLEELKAELHQVLSARTIQLHHWVNLVFNTSPVPVKKAKNAAHVRTEKRDLRFFIDVQWALFENDPNVLEMITREIRRRGGQYMSLTGLKSVAAPKSSTGTILKKRKQTQVMQRKKAHKRPDISSRRPTARSMPDLSSVGVPEKAAQHDVIAKDTDERQSATKSGQAAREKNRELRTKFLIRSASTSGRHRMGIRSCSVRSVAGLHRAKKDNALRSKKRDQLKNNRRRKTPPHLMEGTATCSSTGGNRDIAQESCETMCTPLGDHSAVSSRQEILSLALPHLDTSTPLDDSPRGPVTLEQSLSVTTPLPTVQGAFEVKQLVSPSSPPARNAALEEVRDSLLADVEVDNMLPDPQVAPPTDYLPITKPPLPGYPPIWAQSRQEVCESFDWFRSYQGGVYHSRNVARGYLLSAFAASRDVFVHGGRLIISHGGGKAQSIRTRQGQHIAQEAADQLAHDKSVRALLENYRTRQPIVLLIDDKYVQFPYDLGIKDITYAVLGFYTVIHAWAEYQPAENERGRVVRYKFAFQWCETQGDPWWLKFDSSGSSEEQELTMQLDDGLEYVEQSLAPFEHIEAISMQCLTCRVSSAQVYGETWACLNPDCPRFWHDMNNRLLRDDLEYNSLFTQLAPASALAIPAEKLEPRLPGPTSPGLTTDYAYTRGWHCRMCGRLSCRSKWEHWECMHCKAVLPVTQRVHNATEFIFFAPPVSFKDFSIAKDSGIEQQVFRIFEIQAFDGSFGQCFTYRLPEGRGFIHHIKMSNPFWNKEADEIFREYQEQASTGTLPFRRWPLRAHKCRGALLTNYFSQNAGVPYRYVGGTENTLPFDKVPHAVVRARDLIQTRVKQALDRDVTFNEVLSAAYMERQKMAFHTDDETGLGPFVAGLSLGSPALMHFRLLAKYCPEGVPRSIAMTLVLRHGDVLAMDGSGVQQYYEHTVVPTNFRIAATARYINTEHPKHEKS